jgi:hypothetical protein
MLLNAKIKALDAIPQNDTEASLCLQRRADGRLWLRDGARELPVRPVRCFPWTAPDEHVSLRDEEEDEVGYVTTPEELDAGSREALVQALEDAGLVLRVTRIEEIEEDYEIRCWKVHTRQGPRAFQTRLETWPRPVPGGGLLVEDVAGDLFWIPELDGLDLKSRKLLWAYVD